ncbi:phosphatase PAP2 family protein [Prevotella ihumii]|uniref:phosphatase PAP2 family protein n=1 Tax=Prevotella ihumii TaxID=1917878 RepID=UPI000980A277|nr:phosphatase PAP2 family protein [Prevotella ihumii]
MSEKNIILTARVVSMLLTPFYLPVIGVLAILVFSYLSTFPWQVKLSLVLMVYLFTVLVPTLLIHIYRQYHGWTLLQLGTKERRMMPYIISILCYFGCLYIMDLIHLPHLITSMLMVALVIQVLCAVINVWWKISTHTAGMGGVLGALVAFSFILNFNPVWWLCLAIVASGIVGSSRIILRQHTLTQVTAGLFLGIVSAFCTIMLI